jgi:hypothetical protein
LVTRAISGANVNYCRQNQQNFPSHFAGNLVQNCVAAGICAFIGEHDGLILRFCPVNSRSAARLLG